MAAAADSVARGVSEFVAILRDGRPKRAASSESVNLWDLLRFLLPKHMANDSLGQSCFGGGSNDARDPF